MLKATKVRLYPTEVQKQHLAQSFGCCRWYWNHSLALANQTYKETGKGLSRGKIQALLPHLKKELEWLKTPYSQCLQVVALNLSRAFINFFEKRAEYPSFKSRHGKQSISYPQNVKLVENAIKFPGTLGIVKAVIHRPVEGAVKTVTISTNAGGHYYASVLVEDGTQQPRTDTQGQAIGLDVGLNHLVVTSDGSKYNNPKWFRKHAKNLKRKQQSLSRKVKGSISRARARKRVARVHDKISRCRSDFLHKLSRRIVDENQVICVENLAVKNMVRNHCLAKSISDAGWGMFATMLKYKAEWEGKVYLEIDRFFPSSKTCSVCLNQIGRLPLDVRSWTCSGCSTHHDRDINAAINIRNEGLRILALGASATAVGGNVRLASGNTQKHLLLSTEAPSSSNVVARAG
ncbi:Mobile element protein [uncultured Synechococcales cyanobacterium]|uniref:Mobile element protein n=3 Tax=Cyanophyceae TaxID=3028117 RepID=A0A6J4VT24_9CYAN|nr:Mobile element protein [uncultured Synechococcales cyanobacterium]